MTDLRRTFLNFFPREKYIRKLVDALITCDDDDDDGDDDDDDDDDTGNKIWQEVE